MCLRGPGREKPPVQIHVSLTNLGHRYSANTCTILELAMKTAHAPRLSRWKPRTCRMLLLLGLPTSLLADPPPDATLEAAFTAFARCAATEAQARLSERLAFFANANLRSEEEVKKLPEHQARNEQEQVLALQRAVLPGGARVHLHGTALDGCLGTLIGCLRDGTFRCAVDVDGSCVAEGRTSVRVSLANLRPLADCGRTESTSHCGRWMTREVELPLNDEVVGRTMALAVQAHRELGSSAPDYGGTQFPDLPYSALAMVIVELCAAACVALDSGDAAGAALAIERGIELEEQSRSPQLEASEIPLAVRSALSTLVALKAKTVRGDADGALEAARRAHRLNVTASVSLRKLELALRPLSLRSARAHTGISEAEVLRLQQWWLDELLPLDERTPAASRRADPLIDQEALEAETQHVEVDATAATRRRQNAHEHDEMR